MVLRRCARIWYAAECAADPDLPMKHLTEGDIYALAIPRVRALLAGEVRWSETSPGDKAIWRGRPREVVTTPPWLESRWENLYDTIDLEPDRCSHHDHRLFWNGDIGDDARSNMQTPGQCAGALLFEIHQMYAEVSRDLSIHDQAVVRLAIGRKLIATFLLREVVLGVAVGVAVGPHEAFDVQINHPVVVEPLTVVMHLEGTAMRTVY
jgi:hypothetical protein